MDLSNAIKTNTDKIPVSRQTAVASKILDWLEGITGFFAVLCLLAILIDIAAGVISRYVFNSSFSWTEVGGRWLFGFMIFLGIALGHRRRNHVALDLLERVLPKRFKAPHAFLVDLIVAFTTICMFFYSIDLMLLVGGTEPLLKVPNVIKYCTIPVGAAIGIIILALRGFDEQKHPYGSLAAVLVAFVLYYINTFGVLSLPMLSPSMIMGISFLFTLFLGVPVAFAMLFSAYLANLGGNLLPMPAVTMGVVNGFSSFLLLAIPMFIFTTEIMNLGGLATRLIDAAAAIVGNARGGLAQVNVLNSFLFGGISGSSGSDAALDSKLIVPQMVRHGYSAKFSCAITASSAVITNIVPPSIAMLIFASLTGASVIRLFIGGIAPAVILTLLQMGMVYIISRRRGYGRTGIPGSLSRTLNAIYNALPVFSLAVLIIVGIRFGVVTPTEAGGMAVFYAFFLGAFFYRDLPWGKVYSGMVNVSIQASMIGFLVGVAAPFTTVLVSEHIPQNLIDAVLGQTTDPQLILFLVVLVGLFLGTCIDLAVSMLLLVPLVFPLLSHVGIDLTHFGVIITITLLLGAITPPVGILVFIPAAITGTPSSDIFKEIIPFFLVMLLGLFAFTWFPSIILSLVRWLV